MLKGFPVGLVNFVLCPRDGGDLKPVQPVAGDLINSGELQCETCKTRIDIRGGILRLAPVQSALSAVMQEEQRTRDLNAGQYEAHFEKWENEIESRTLFEHAEAFVNKVVLELGCGTGRITRMLAPVSQCVLAADFSEGSLELLAASLQDETNVGLIWTDATQLRLRPKSCDAVISIQLLEHIPEQQQRIKFVRCAHLSLREGGVLLLSAYYYNGMRRILRRGQNGTHPGGIFYHRFSMAELQEQLRHGFHVQITKPIQMDRRVAKLIQPITSSLTSMMEHSFLAQLFGRLLFVKAASLPDRSF